MSAKIEYIIPRASHVTLTVTNILGQTVKTLVDGHEYPGVKSVVWDGTNYTGQPVAAGMYLYTIKAEDFSETKKMMLVK